MNSKPSGSKSNANSKQSLEKRTRLTLSDKIAIIKNYHKLRCNKEALATLHNCHEAQIDFILKDEEKYLKQWARQKLRPKNASGRLVIGAVVYEWITRVRRHGFSVTHDEIRKVAENVSKIINCHDFRATDLWIHALRKKYRLTDLGPLKSMKAKRNNYKKSFDVKKILIDFKEKGLPERVQLKRSILNSIDLSNLKLERKKKVRTKTDNKSNSEASDEYVTNSTESINFITAMLIDDDDEDEPSSENRKKNKEELKVQPTTKTISSYKEALEYLKPLENFSIIQEDVRAIKKISKLVSLFAEEMATSV